MRAFLTLALVLLASCNRPTNSAAPPPPTAPAPTEANDCTFETKLVPGVPGSPGHLLPSEVNPNGASELAALMRTMQNDLKAARAALLEGKGVSPLYERHRKIRCAWPTDLKDRTVAFDGFAQAYLVAVRSLDEDAANAKERFQGVINACRTCHQASCPGPIAAIDALSLSAPPTAAAVPAQGEACNHAATDG